MNTHGLIILGTKGVGKSFLYNLLLEEEISQSHANPMAITNKILFGEKTIDGTQITIADLPAYPQGKVEISEAFRKYPYSKVIFVFGGNRGGRIDEDLVAFTALDSAFRFERKALCIVVNNLPRVRPHEYEGSTTVFLQENGLKHPTQIVFCSTANNNAEKKLIRAQILDALSQCTPAYHTKHQEIVSLYDEITKLHAKIKERETQFELQKQQFTLQINELQQRHDEKLAQIYNAHILPKNFASTAPLQGNFVVPTTATFPASSTETFVAGGGKLVLNLANNVGGNVTIGPNGSIIIN